MRYWLCVVAIEAWLAVMTVAAGRVMSAVDAYTSAPVTTQLVQLHIETTLLRVKIAIARYELQFYKMMA